MSEGKKNFHFRRSLVYKDTDTQKKFLLFKPVMGLKSINKIKKHFIYFWRSKILLLVVWSPWLISWLCYKKKKPSTKQSAVTPTLFKAFAPKCTLFCHLWFDRLLPGPIVVLHTHVGNDVVKDKDKIYLVSLTAYIHKRWIKSSKFKFKRKDTVKRMMRKKWFLCFKVYLIFRNTHVLTSKFSFCFQCIYHNESLSFTILFFGWWEDPRLIFKLYFMLIASLSFLLTLHTLNNSSLPQCGHINR